MIQTQFRRIAPLCLLVAGSALAHHSFAMFDSKKTVSFKATVVQFQWTNPHSYLDVLNPDDKQDYTLEAGGVNGLFRQGIRKTSLHKGDVIEVEFHPLRNGAPGGNLITVKKSDGSTLTFGFAGPPPPKS